LETIDYHWIPLDIIGFHRISSETRRYDWTIPEYMNGRFLRNINGRLTGDKNSRFPENRNYRFSQEN